MANELTLEEITALLLEKLEEKGGDRLPPTAYNKLLHFVDRNLSQKGIDAELPLFWYMFGRVAAKDNSGVYVETIGGKRGVECELSVSDVTASDLAVREAERGIVEGLDLYFAQGLDGLIRASYEDAPYEVQRTYLDLKETMETEADPDQATFNDFATDQNTRTRSLLYEFIRDFPEDEFTEYERDLHKWYRLLSKELDSEDYDSQRALKLTEQFWRLFCLELACRENDGLSKEAIAAELNDVESIDAEKATIRDWFSSEERELTRESAMRDETARQAAEAVTAAHLSVGLGS